MKLRILVASSFEAGSQYAHAINTVKMAQGFVVLGHEVTILCKASPVFSLSQSQLSDGYAVSDSIRWIQAPCRMLSRQIGSHWDFAVLGMAAAMKVRPHFVYARNYVFPCLTSLLGMPTVAETHAHPDNRQKPFLRLIKTSSNRNFRALVTISRRLAAAYEALGVPSDKLAVLPDGADTELFRRPVQLPPSPYPNTSRVVAYAGHLYDYKGIPTVLEAAKLLSDAQFHFVGGFPEDIQRQKERARSLEIDNVFFHGMRTHAEVPPYLWHADVLLLPPSEKHPSAQWTSPVKLGEYLASGTPVVVTSIPALRDWLTDEEVRWVEPDDPASLAEGISALLNNEEYGRRLSSSAAKKASSFSFETRVRSILERINSSNS